jgi:DNA repair photolyase
VVEVLAETKHPLIITTKSDRLLRDIDLLSQMAKDDLVGVAVSVTTLDPQVARTLEPRAPHPRRRLAAIARLIDAGVPTDLIVVPGAFHGFDVIAEQSSVARRFNAARLAALSWRKKTRRASRGGNVRSISKDAMIVSPALDFSG